MNAFSKILIVIASLLGVKGLILDAIGAHALSNWLSGNPAAQSMIASWQTAVRTQLLHALFLIVLVALGDKIEAPWKIASAFCIVVGLMLFSGSIYIKTLTTLESATRVAPTGGVLLMLGWLVLGLGALLKK